MPSFALCPERCPRQPPLCVPFMYPRSWPGSMSVSLREPVVNRHTPSLSASRTTSAGFRLPRQRHTRLVERRSRTRSTSESPCCGRTWDVSPRVVRRPMHRIVRREADAKYACHAPYGRGQPRPFLSVSPRNLHSLGSRDCRFVDTPEYAA